MITEEIIKKAQAGDSEAFASIYNETVKTAYYVAKRILISEDATEDVLQEAYIAVYQHLSDYKSGNFQGWVDTIVANRAKNYIRKKNPILFSEMESEERPVVEFEEEKIEFRPDAKVDYNETQRLILEIIDNLSPEQRLSVILFYFENRSVKEIAEICECSENTVKSRLNYARKKIKEDVLELEKKGTKLYGISIMPFIMWMLTEKAKAAEIPGELAAKVLVSTGAAAGTAGSVAGGTAVGTTAGAATASVAGTTAGATSSVVATTAAVATKVGMALGAKIAIGAAVVAVTAGAVVAGIAMKNKDDTPKDDVKVTAEPQNEELPKDENLNVDAEDKGEADTQVDENTEEVVEDTEEEEKKVVKTEITKKEGLTHFYEYDNKGNLIKHTTTDETGKMTYSEVYVYDENGNKVEGIVDVYPSTSLSISSHSYKKYEYDEHGNQTKEYDVLEDGTEEIVQEFVYEYDEYGNIYTSTFKQGEIEYITTTDTTYDENGRPVQRIFSDDMGMLYRKVTWSYYEDGTEKQSVSEDSSTTYISDKDEQGRTIKTTEIKKDGATRIAEWSYDDKGNMISIKSYNEGEEGYEENLWTYDEEGKKLKEQYVKDGDVLRTDDYIYDEKGSLIRFVSDTTSSGVQSEIIYEYDENDDMIKKVEKYTSGEIAETQYTYHE